MDFKKYVRRRRGYALASVVALIFLKTILLGVAVSHLNFYSRVMEMYYRRFQARNALESMANLAFKWLLEEVGSESRPRARAIIALEYLTDFDLLRIFASAGIDGSEVKIYDLDYAAEKVKRPVDRHRIFPPSFPGGYMIRATVEKQGLAPLMLESVYAVTFNTMPDGSIIEILDEKPVYSRELFLR